MEEPASPTREPSPGTTVELEHDGDGTQLTFTEQGAFFDGLEDPAGREHGTGALLDRLAGVLAE